jgi:hypothetical protein
MISVGKEKYKVWLKDEKLDRGIVITVGGGEFSHIGSIVLSEPRKSRIGKGFSCTSQVINIRDHKEEKIARMFAEKICLKKNVPVLCVCGIHIHDATKKDIRILVNNAEKLLKKYMS